MILQAQSKKVEQYGYPFQMKYDNDKFHGTVKGVAIGIIDNKDGEVVENYVSGSTEQEKMELLNKMIGDKDLLLIEDGITQFVNGELRPRTIYKIPYCAIEHSIYQPAIVMNNISGASNVSYEVEVEVLLATSDGLNRYLMLHFSTRNVPVWELVHDFFDEIDEDSVLARENGFEYHDESDEGEAGWYLDFYDAAGSPYWEGGFKNMDRFRDMIIGMRVMKMECKIDQD